MNGRLQGFLPIIGVVALFAVWSLVAWRQWVDPVLLPSPLEAFRAFWSGMHGALGRDRGRHRDPARDRARLLGEALSLARVRHRLLPLDTGLGDVPALPG